MMYPSKVREDEVVVLKHLPMRCTSCSCTGGDTIGHVEVKGDIEGFVLVDGGGVDVERIEAAKQAPKS